MSSMSIPSVVPFFERSPTTRYSLRADPHDLPQGLSSPKSCFRIVCPIAQTLRPLNASFAEMNLPEPTSMSMIVVK